MFNKSSRMCLIKISQPSIFLICHAILIFPFFFSLHGLKRTTRFISLSSHRPLLSLKWWGFYNRILGLSHWFHEALLLLCPLSVLRWQPQQGHRCCLWMLAEEQRDSVVRKQRLQGRRSDEWRGRQSSKYPLWETGQLLHIECSGQVVHTRQRWL